MKNCSICGYNFNEPIKYNCYVPIMIDNDADNLLKNMCISHREEFYIWFGKNYDAYLCKAFWGSYYQDDNITVDHITEWLGKKITSLANKYNGDEIKYCSARNKTDQPCNRMANNVIDGKYVCGVHKHSHECGSKLSFEEAREPTSLNRAIQAFLE
jgi:hypothetical protein